MAINPTWGGAAALHETSRSDGPQSTQHAIIQDSRNLEVFEQDASQLLNRLGMRLHRMRGAIHHVLALRLVDVCTRIFDHSIVLSLWRGAAAHGMIEWACTSGATGMLCRLRMNP